MRRQLGLAVLATALLLGLGGCGDDESKSLPDLRTQVRDTAADLIPQLATEVGGTAGDGNGRYDKSGGGLSATTFAYSAGARITLDQPGPHSAAIEKALKDLGYETTTSSNPKGDTSISAKKDGLSILVSEYPRIAPDEVSVSVASPYVKVPKDEVEDYLAKVAKEPLELK